jgi:sortase A
MFRSILKCIACCLIVGALFFLAIASEMALKAIMGQYFLNDAWEKTLHSGTQTKPWESADFEVVGELKVPRLGLSRIVLNSVSGEAMAWGIGTLDTDVSKQSPLILAGHRDTHMEFMSKLHVGDRVSFRLANGSLKSFEIVKSMVLNSPELQLEDQFEDQKTLILTTCWPFNANQSGPERYVMIGQETT